MMGLALNNLLHGRVLGNYIVNQLIWLFLLGDVRHVGHFFGGPHRILLMFRLLWELILHLGFDMVFQRGTLVW